jgi:hypothetical protein
MRLFSNHLQRTGGAIIAKGAEPALRGHYGCGGAREVFFAHDADS